MRETAAEGMATVRHVAFRELDARTGSYAVVLTTDQRIVVIELPRRAADWRRRCAARWWACFA